jgi:cathepsin H
MQTVIDKIGPIIVSLNADLLYNYTGGIINSPNCSNKLNHNALAVGYNKTGNYYIVKNRYINTY